MAISLCPKAFNVHTLACILGHEHHRSVPIGGVRSFPTCLMLLSWFQIDAHKSIVVPTFAISL